MSLQQPSWGKLFLALVFLLYLATLLAFTLVSPYTHVAPGPKIELGSNPGLPTVAPDFRAIKDIPTRKQAFFDFMRPLVAYQNAFYTQERERLQTMAAKAEAGKRLSRSDRRKLAYWSRKLRLDDELPLDERLEYLQRRVHIIPEAMVLAQAAAESAWGQSRFARQANNYFGQWCYSAGCGLVPLRRNANARHEVRKFDSALGAVRAYFRNINTHRAYRPLREKRLALDSEGEEVQGQTLVDELGSYSERGQHYIDELRLIIRGNELE